MQRSKNLTGRPSSGYQLLRDDVTDREELDQSQHERVRETEMLMTITTRLSTRALMSLMMSPERRRRLRIHGDVHVAMIANSSVHHTQVPIGNSFVYQAEVGLPATGDTRDGFFDELTDMVKEGWNLDPEFFLKLTPRRTVSVRTDLGIVFSPLTEKNLKAPVIQSVSYSRSRWRSLLGLGGTWTVKGPRLDGIIVWVATAASRRELRRVSFSQEIVDGEARDIVRYEESMRSRMRHRGMNRVYISPSSDGIGLEGRSKMVNSAYWYAKGSTPGRGSLCLSG